MANNEPEYKLVKCTTCGQIRKDVKGPRVVRLAPDHKRLWQNNITKMKAALWLMIVAAILSGLGLVNFLFTLLAGESVFLPLALLGTGIIMLCLGVMYLMQFERWKRNFITLHYNVPENESCHIVYE